MARTRRAGPRDFADVREAWDVLSATARIVMRHVGLASFFLLVLGCSSSPGTSTSPDPAGGSPDGGAPTDAGADAAPPPCSGQAGTFHDQAFAVDGETRHYWLHVPATYDCTKPAAMLVDFHGTGFGGASDTVEESWATPDLVAAADDQRFIVVRPRSRSKPSSGGNVFQWDINPGDVAKNKAFVTALVDDLRSRYHVDPARLYASGFSNGPNMALQFIADEPSLFRGYGIIAGGLNAPLKRSAKFDATAPRIYTMTGHRDYMRSTKERLFDFLAQHAYPKASLFDREADTGHEVYGWNFREAFAWMDRGERPPQGTLASGWTIEATTADESFVEAAAAPDGSTLVAGARGGIYARTAGGAWSKRATVLAAPLTDLCVTPAGRWFAAGGGEVATSTDGSTWSLLPALPEFGSMGFGFTYATTVGCAPGRVTVGGAGSTATSTDDGKTWTAAVASQGGYGAYLAAVRHRDASWLALGYYDFIGASADGATFTPAAVPGTTQWWNDGALGDDGVAIAVGEGGALMRSTDGGATFSGVVSPTREDLYAVALRGSRAVAAGAHGTVLTSSDGGLTWTDRSTGLDGYLGAARFLSTTTILVLGERGAALRREL
jgi:predicted esterase/photosystem II stability/assembly factor-like uncharacterized protein